MPQDIDRLRCTPSNMYFCAWCNEPIDRPPGNLEGRPTVKHGMCDRCVSEHVDRLPALRVEGERRRSA